MLKILLSLLLILLGGFMIYLGVKADMLPPTLTGIGFFIISILFNLPKNKQ
ncbi:hypothetical protein VSO92_03595 [Myroides pelagicus]|uniref:hypothetical protein n=1 Tax=Myroides pelagicus TaxID=270914 RepID=UPI001961586C|nr:hypothetical protein [Myroides pelagicus]MEC4113188.1 hypothetical protein [Myroides pelagicus]